MTGWPSGPFPSPPPTENLPDSPRAVIFPRMGVAIGPGPMHPQGNAPRILPIWILQPVERARQEFSNFCRRQRGIVVGRNQIVRGRTVQHPHDRMAGVCVDRQGGGGVQQSDFDVLPVGVGRERRLHPAKMLRSEIAGKAGCQGERDPVGGDGEVMDFASSQEKEGVLVALRIFECKDSPGPGFLKMGQPFVSADFHF